MLLIFNTIHMSKRFEHRNTIGKQILNKEPKYKFV